MKLKKLIAASFIFLFVLKSFAGNGNAELLAGWKELSTNNFPEVEKHFQLAAKDNSTAGDAYLSLAIYHLTIYKNDLAFADFKNFLSVSQSPDAAIFAFENTNLLQSLSSDQKISFYEGLTKMASVSEIIRNMAYERLIGYYEDRNETNKMHDAQNKIGSLNDWQLLGTFDNLSGSGFSEDVGAVSHPEKSYPFKDKHGTDVHWFNLSTDHIRNDRWIDFEYYFSASNSIVYAQSFVTAPDDIECQLRLGTSGSYKVWIDDRLIMSDEEERNNDLDTYISTIKLSKGTNRILIQLGESEIESLNFMCRITDKDGKPIQGLKCSADYKDYNKNYDYKGTMVPVFAEEYYKDKISKNPELLLNYFLLANAYLRNDKAFEAANVLNDAEKIAPDCIYLLVLKSEQTSRAKNYPGLSAVMKKMKELVPDNYNALQLDYKELINSENFDGAEEVMNKIKKLYGEDESLLDMQINIYASRKQVEKMISYIDAAYKKYPDYYPFVNYKFIVESQIRKDNSSGEKVVLNFLSKHQNITAMDDLMNHYLNTNANEKATDMLIRMTKLHPYGVGYINTLARLYYLTGNYKKAHEYNGVCHSIAPYIGTYYELDGDIFDAEKNPLEATNSYTKCISYTPTNYSARTKLRKLNSKPDIFDSFEKPDFKQLYNSAPDASAYPENHSLIILDDMQNVVYKGGASMRKRYLMVKIFNSTGIDKWKEYYIDYFKGQRLIVDEAYIIKKNGSKVDADRNDEHIVFTNLEINDAICLSYKIEDYYTGKLAQHLNDYHYFNYFIPVLKSAYELIIDSTIAFNYKVLNSDMKPEIKNLDEFKMYRWVDKNKPGFTFENDMPELADIAPVLRISTYNNWDEVSKWYASISSSKAKPGYEVGVLVKQLFPSNESLTDMQKAKRIYNYIVKEIRYSSVGFRQSGLIPQSTSNTLNSRIGDCKDISTLFVAMCREVNIDAHLTLVCTNDNGNNALFIPSIDFNHCIAAVMLGGKKYFVELTSDCMPFTSYNESLCNAQALEINNNSSNDIFRLPSQTNKNIIKRECTISFDNEKILVKKTNIKKGTEAAGMRYTYRDIGKEQQKKVLGKSLLEEYPSAVLEDLHFDDNISGTSDSVTYSFSYSSDEAISDIGGIKVIKLPFSDAFYSLNLLSQVKRIYPVNTTRDWFTMNWEETINLSLPAGASILKIPESKNYSSEFGNYSLTFKPSGNSYIITRKLSMKANDTISPEKFPDFKSFMQKVIKADATQLALK